MTLASIDATWTGSGYEWPASPDPDVDEFSYVLDGAPAVVTKETSVTGLDPTVTHTIAVSYSIADAAPAVPVTYNPAPPSGPHGIYVFAPGSAIAKNLASVAAGPFSDVQGYDCLIGWDVLEATQGQYDWSVVDAALADAHAAGKQVQFCILPGFAEPAWVLQQCRTITIDQFNSGRTVVMANPTDPKFQQLWFAFIAAFGAHLATLPSKPISLQATGGGNQGEMVIGKLISPATWADAGITQTSLTDFWKANISQWAAVGLTLGVSVSLALAEPLGTSAADQILPGLFAWAKTAWPNLLFQQNGLKDTTPQGPGSFWQYLQAASAYTTVGWQMFGTTAQDGGNLENALKIGLAADGKFFQIYLTDILDPAQTPALRYLAGQLGT